MLAITLIMMMMMTARELAHSSLSLYQRASGPRLSIKKKKRRKKEKKYYVNSNFLNNFVKKKKISQCEADSKFTVRKVISITHLNFLSYVPHVFCQVTALTSL